jgi:hypothetical protein
MPTPADDSSINYPEFDPENGEEDDIFLYSGYMKPGVHDIVIFDPSEEKFYRLENLVIFPRKEDIKHSKQPVDEDDNEATNEALEYHGTNYKYIRSRLYGNLLKDSSQRVVNLAYKYDTDPRFFKESTF